MAAAHGLKRLRARTQALREQSVPVCDRRGERDQGLFPQGAASICPPWLASPATTTHLRHAPYCICRADTLAPNQCRQNEEGEREGPDHTHRPGGCAFPHGCAERCSTHHQGGTLLLYPSCPSRQNRHRFASEMAPKPSYHNLALTRRRPPPAIRCLCFIFVPAVDSVHEHPHSRLHVQGRQHQCVWRCHLGRYLRLKWGEILARRPMAAAVEEQQ